MVFSSHQGWTFVHLRKFRLFQVYLLTDFIFPIAVRPGLLCVHRHFGDVCVWIRERHACRHLRLVHQAGHHGNHHSDVT